MKLKKALSKRLKLLREAAGLSQQDIATRGELSLSLVAKLEQGKKADPRASTILALARALGVKPGQLLDDLLPPAEPEPLPAAEPGPELELATKPKKGKGTNGRAAKEAKGAKKARKKAKKKA